MKFHLFKPVILFVFFTIIFLGLSSGCASPDTTSSSGSSPASPVANIIRSPAATAPGVNSQATNIIFTSCIEGKYTFLVFYKQSDPKSEDMKAAISLAQQNDSTKVSAAYVDIADANEKTLLGKYNVSRAPIPLTLVIAPNGAVVKYFPEKVSSNDLKNAFVSPKMAEVLKATQEQKLIFLYVANANLPYYQENLTVIRAVADSSYNGVSSIIQVDPEDAKELSLLNQCQVTLPVKETNLLIVNGGSILGRLNGKFDQQTLSTTVTSSCSGGSCCPSGGN